MSLTITVRPSGQTSGGETHTLPAEGDNGNQEIDTRAEAEAALAFLPDGSTSTVVIGERSYTRAQLIEIRDRNAAPAAPADGGTVMAPGASHGFFVEGQYAGGLGDRGHNGGGVRLGYRAGIPLANGNTQLTLDPVIGFDIGHYSGSFTTPGGEGVNSAFTRYGGLLGADLRVAPNFWDHRMSFSGGFRFGVGGFGTADSTMVSLPPSCTPGDFGRGECEPNAGPRTGNAGTTGLMNFDQGSARGTGGAYIYTGIPLTVGIEFLRGDWGNLRGVVGFEPGYTHLMPNDGHGFGFWSMAGTLGISGNIGGSAVQRPRRTEEAPVAPRTDRAAAQTRTAGEALTLADDAAVRAFGGLGADARILGVQFDSLPEDTSAPYEVPASAMTAGSHEIKIRYRNPGDTTDRIRVVPLTIGEPTRVPEGNNGANYGAVLNMPATAARPAPDMVGGVATARPIPVGNVQTTADFPANSTYQLYVDGNPVGSPAALPADRNTVLTLPASVTDGPHQVQLRVMRPNQTTIIYPTVAVAVGPAFPTLTSFDAVADPVAPPYRYRTAAFSVTVTASSPGRVRITAGGNTWEKDVVAGPNTLSLLAAREARTHYTGPVTIQPLSGAGGSLVGTAVNSTHNVELGTAGHHGGHRAPAARPPRL